VQVVSLVLDVLEEFLASFTVLLLLAVCQEVVGDEVEVNWASTGITKSLDATLSLSLLTWKFNGFSLSTSFFRFSLYFKQANANAHIHTYIHTLSLSRSFSIAFEV